MAVIEVAKSAVGIREEVNALSPIHAPLSVKPKIMRVMENPPLITAGLLASSSITHTAVITGSSISGTTLTVGAVSSGTIYVGDTVAGALSNTVIVKQLTGTVGGAGTYQVNYSQTAATCTSTSQTATPYTGAASTAWKITAPNPGIGTNGLIVPRKADNSDNVGANIVWEIRIAAPVLAFGMTAFNSQFDVFCDGELVQLAAFSTGSSGSRYEVRLDWSSDADPWRERHYRISGINMLFSSVAVPTVGTVSYPSDRSKRKLCYVFGDSYTAGVGARSVARTCMAVMAEELSMDYYADGIGSMGWNSTGSNLPTTRVANVLALMNRQPDLIVSAFGYNDAGGNMTTLAANYADWVVAVRAAWPDVPIITLGPWTPTGPTTNLTTVKTALFTQASALSVLTGDIGSVVTLANSYVMTSSDNVHPTPDIGSEFIGVRVKPIVSALI